MVMGRTLHYEFFGEVGEEEFGRLMKLGDGYNEKYRWTCENIKVFRNYEDGHPWGFTKVGENEWNAKLVADFCAEASRMLPGVAVRLRDEGEYVVPGSVVFRDGVAEVDYKDLVGSLVWAYYTNDRYGSFLSWYTRAVASVEGGKLFLDVREEDYADHPPYASMVGDVGGRRLELGKGESPKRCGGCGGPVVETFAGAACIRCGREASTTVRKPKLTVAETDNVEWMWEDVKRMLTERGADIEEMKPKYAEYFRLYELAGSLNSALREDYYENPEWCFLCGRRIYSSASEAGYTSKSLIRNHVHGELFVREEEYNPPYRGFILRFKRILKPPSFRRENPYLARFLEKEKKALRRWELEEQTSMGLTR